jgi:hypothetical protein
LGEKEAGCREQADRRQENAAQHNNFSAAGGNEAK